jgi:histidinol-phosphate aminotransferase
MASDKVSQICIPSDRVDNPGLVRPGWTTGQFRDPQKLWLDKNENPDPELAAVVSKASSEMAQSTLGTYPECGPLYRKLAAHLGVKPENLILTAGSDGAIRSVFEAYISPVDKVIHTNPTFAMYSVYSQIYKADVRIVEYVAGVEAPQLPSENLIQEILDFKPKLVCLPNPDSPTGTVFAPEELLQIIKTAANTGSLILIDEAYYPFYPNSAIDWLDDYPNLIITRSTGKAWGMAGFRVGFAVASIPVADILHKVRPMYEINSIAVGTFDAMLDRYDEVLESVTRLNEGKDYFLNTMENLGFKVLRGEGNFFHVAFDQYADQIHTELDSLVYYRQDFSQPCLKGYSRFSSAPVAMLQPIVDAISAIVK